MGFDALWISPIVANTADGYHGYWMQQLHALNPNFGSESDLEALISACHSRGMFIMLDVVGNHVGPVDMCDRVERALAACVSPRMQELLANCAVRQRGALPQQVPNH
jgi:hypothetical protein